jgi:hypothetical protein
VVAASENDVLCLLPPLPFACGAGSAGAAVPVAATLACAF